MERIEVAQKHAAASRGAHSAAPAVDMGSADAGSANSGSARIAALVNSHEKLREEVAETLREIDQMIEEHG